VIPKSGVSDAHRVSPLQALEGTTSTSLDSIAGTFIMKFSLELLYWVAVLTPSLVSASVVPQKPLNSVDEDAKQPLPLVIWHGLGDKFVFTSSINGYSNTT
jgi:hypothetical protein